MDKRTTKQILEDGLFGPNPASSLSIRRVAMVELRYPESSLGYSQLSINKIYIEHNEKVRFQGYELVVKTRKNTIIIPIGEPELHELLLAGIPMKNIIKGKT